MDVVFYPMRLVHDNPLLGLAPALVFFISYIFARVVGFAAASKGARLSVLAAGIIWLLFTSYEWRMSYWERTVIAPIRVDLLLLTPVLYVITVIGLVGLWKTLSHSVAPRDGRDSEGPGSSPS